MRVNGELKMKILLLLKTFTSLLVLSAVTNLIIGLPFWIGATISIVITVALGVLLLVAHDDTEQA